MRDGAVSSRPKTVMLVVSLLVFFICLALTEKWSVRRFNNGKLFAFLTALEFIGFAFVVLMNTGNSYVVCTVTATFVYIQLITLIAAEAHTSARKPRNKSA